MEKGGLCDAAEIINPFLAFWTSWLQSGWLVALCWYLDFSFDHYFKIQITEKYKIVLCYRWQKYDRGVDQPTIQGRPAGNGNVGLWNVENLGIVLSPSKS